MTEARIEAPILHSTAQGAVGVHAERRDDEPFASPVCQLDLAAGAVESDDPPRDVLDFELADDSPSLTNDGRPKRWVVVRPKGGATGVLLAKADGERQSEAVGNQTAGRVGFFLRVDDFDRSLQRLVDADVEILTPVRSESYGRFVVFLDIAGNRWDLLGE